jgi:Icc-related predicted phosphoesterase
MKIQYISDLHLEFPQHLDFYKKNPIIPSADYLCIAGDFAYLEPNSMWKSSSDCFKPEVNEFLDYFSKNWKEVFIVPGNHEYYFGYPLKELPRSLNIRSNVTLLNNDAKLIHTDDPEYDLYVLGGTMWSYIQSNEFSKVKNSMNDYNYIVYIQKSEYSNMLFTPGLCIDEHKKFESFLSSNLDFMPYTIKYNKAKKLKVVICTHHAPHKKCIHNTYQDSGINSAYFTDMSNIIEKYKPNVWIYGHTHAVNDFNLFDTQIVENSIGYNPQNKKLHSDWNQKIVNI